MVPILTISVKRLGYEYALVKDSQLTVYPADRVWLRGLNGVGKTTLLKAIAGLIPFKGSRCVNSLPVYLSNQCLFFDFLSVSENLQYWQINATVDFVNMDQRFGELSLGQRIYLQIYCLLQRPDVLLLLDDCLAYLDDNSMEGLFNESLRLKKTLIFTSQDVRVAQFSNRTVLISNRRLLEFT